jgi:hypothetical protein
VGQQVEEIDLNARASLGYVSTPDSVVSSPRLPDDLDTLEDVPIVLALQAPTVNFYVEEIQQHELLVADNSDENNAPNIGQSSSSANVVTGELQVVMALLPENLDIDPVLSSSSGKSSRYKNKSAEGFRL